MTSIVFDICYKMMKNDEIVTHTGDRIFTRRIENFHEVYIHVIMY